MNSLRGHIIIAGAILLAGILIAYQPFQKPQPHLQCLISGTQILQFDSTTGQVWGWNFEAHKWVKLPKPE
jgi:hypothetical protein